MAEVLQDHAIPDGHAKDTDKENEGEINGNCNGDNEAIYSHEEKHGNGSDSTRILASPDTEVDSVPPSPAIPNGISTEESEHAPKLDKESSNEDIDDSVGHFPRKQRGNRRKFGMNAIRQKGANDASSRLVGEYQFGNILGRGIFGHVYSAINVNTNENAAIKQLDPRKVSKELHESLKREIQTLKSLNHPNIVNFISVLVDEDAYVVMEHLENGSVYDVIQKYGPLPEQLAARYTGQILNALIALQEHNIVHRNLKGSNLLLKNGDIKLTDFSPAIKDDDKKYSIIGSPYWMAPEVFDMSTPSCSADIWSLGCCVIEMITGNPPYRYLSPIAALLQITRDESPALPEGLSADLQDFLHNCLQKDPKKRKDAKALRSHSWVVKHENAKKEIADYPLRQPASPKGQVPPEDLFSISNKLPVQIEIFSDKDKEDVALAEFLAEPTDEGDGASAPTVQESFQFLASATVPSGGNSVDALKKEVEALRKLNDTNVALANEIKFQLEQAAEDRQRLAKLTLRQLNRAEAAEEQLRTVARSTAHSNMLLKRTNQLATDAVTKHSIIATNIKRIEEVILEGDSGPKKLATFLYKKLAAENLNNVTLSATLSYSSNVKQWKEKRGWLVIKDNFLFLYKNEKGSAPAEIVYLGDGARLAPLSEDQCKRKHCFRVGEAMLIGTDTAEQYSEWMLALSTPQKWWELPEDSSPSTPHTAGRSVKQLLKEEYYGGSSGEKDKKKKEDKAHKDNSPPTAPRTTVPDSAVVVPIFGVSLSELFARENNNVPAFYMDMINYLQEYALHEEGILRLSGGLSEINSLRAMLQRGEYPDYTTHDPNAVAGLLKCFFRELPEPLIPEPYHSGTLEIMANNDMLDEQRIVELKVIIDQLPPENYVTLQILMQFLVQVNMAADKNKMTVQNLITCMVPTLKCVPGVFMYVIPNYDFIFGNWEESTPS